MKCFRHIPFAIEINDLLTMSHETRQYKWLDQAKTQVLSLDTIYEDFIWLRDSDVWIIFICTVS